MSYPPQYGHYPPPPGYNPYGGPYRPAGPNNTLAYVCAGLFLVCGVLALVVAIVGWDGTSSDIDMLVALIGAAFSDEFTGNLDFAISFTMSVACTTITFALVLLARVDFVRWILAFVGALVCVYYLYGVVKLLADGGGRYLAMVLVSLLLWGAATVLVLLPGTGRAMRGYQRTLLQNGYRPF